MKKNSVILSLIFSLLLGLNICANDHADFADKQLQKAEKQLLQLNQKAYEADRIPRTVNEDNQIHWAHKRFDWTEGFYPGTCWYMYKYTNKPEWKEAAEKFQNQFNSHKHLTTNHDLGFVFNCSYGNGLKLTENKKFEQVMIQAATSLSTRFNKTIGAIKSWDVKGGWQATRGWKYPVIIDNMMNLELLFEVTNMTGDSKYRDLAIEHANTTLKNHFRKDNSSFHVIDYEPETGAVRHKHTAQGFAHSSAWARGQAWGLYGYTVCYRYTRDVKYLKQAIRIYDFLMKHPNLPKDMVPYWDFNADKIPNAHRDASAAAIIASAIVELSQYSNQVELDSAVKILKSLSSDKYFAKLGENHNFILKHSVGSIPHGAEIDKPLNYADYYYIEALLRLKEMK
jgi:hypothetical protein